MSTPSPACHLSHRGVIRVGGDDRRAFLQGLVSNDIYLCSTTQSIYAALLSPQGKFLHDLFLYDMGDAFLIDCEAERSDDLLQRFGSYKLRAKVTLENVSNAFVVLAYPDGRLGLPDPRLPELGTRGVFEKSSVIDLQTSDAASYDHHRLSLGVGDGSRDMIVGKSTLAEGNFDLLNGISWSKGCYVGQELTARMHHRALVKKRLFPLRIKGAAPTFGSVLRHNGEEIGEMRSSKGAFGLALLNVEQAMFAIRDGVSLTSETANLRPFLPDWLKV